MNAIILLKIVTAFFLIWAVFALGYFLGQKDMRRRYDSYIDFRDFRNRIVRLGLRFKK